MHPASDRVAGATRIALDMSYARPQYASFSGSAAVAPFINERWQVGLSPTWALDDGIRPRYMAGIAEVEVSYFPLGGVDWRPYVGAFASQRGASFASGYGVYGLQAGWLHFLSPSLAFRGEFRYRRYSVEQAPASTELLVEFDPYILGPAARRLTTLPSFGVFDATLVADYQMRPLHSLSINSTFAPFLTPWVQAGATANVEFAFYRSSGTHLLEMFTRGYLPVDARFVPFADAFVDNESIGYSELTRGSHGARAGVRTYLTPGVALDVALHWRHFDSEDLGAGSFTPHAERTIRATIATQFRAIRPRSR